MKQLVCVFESDSVNRYGTRFSVQALVSALWQEHGIGIPMLISHDFLRAIGWSYPLAVHFEPGLTRLSGLGVMVENKEESEQLSQALVSFMVRMAAEYSAEVAELKNLLSNHLNGNEKVLCAKECLALVDDGLCARVFPDIFEQADSDGLVPLNKLEPIGPGVFRIGELAIFAHDYFRRSLSKMNTLNVPFLKRIQNITDSNISVKLAIDPDMIGLASTYRGYQELEYWWGPKFNDNLTDIPRGVTHHEASELDRIFHGISGTQFWWQSRDRQHILEAEELRNIPTSIGEGVQYGCRYVHSIVDEMTSHIDHFDGAIRMYPEGKMIERLTLDISRAGRHNDYTKIWRIDGIIPISLWKSLLSDYFRDNRLVGEYLGAEEDIYDTSIPEVDSPLTKYVPHSMRKGDGVRIALSYHDYKDMADDERAVTSLDVLTSGTNTTKYVESWVVELEKALSRISGSLHIPNDIQLVNFKDFYINFPLITHNKRGMPDNLHKTIEALRLLIQAFGKRGDDRIVSYTIGFPIGDKEARISVLGHIQDLADWMAHPLCIPPTSQDELIEWSENVAEFLKDTYPQGHDKPALTETLMPSGVLLISRKPLEERFEINYEETDSGLLYSLRIPDDEQELKQCVERGEIVPALAFIKIEAKCTKCQQAYRSCGCSKMLDNDVAEEITRAQLLHPFWTDRPVY